MTEPDEVKGGKTMRPRGHGGRIAWTEVKGEGMHVVVLESISSPSTYLAFLKERNVPYLSKRRHGQMG